VDRQRVPVAHPHHLGAAARPIRNRQVVEIDGFCGSVTSTIDVPFSSLLPVRH